MRLENFLVPLRATLTVALPAKESAAAAGGGGGGGAEPAAPHEPFPNSGLRISHFDERVDVYASKAKPKKISLRTTGGANVRFLVKKEQHGDLRKDARLMEVAAVVNRALGCDADARRRKLRLRTYSVLCLNEESGILEWLNGTKGLRFAIEDGYKAARPFVECGPRAAE